MRSIQFWLTGMLFAAGVPLTAQLYPQGSQVNSYFPQLAVGGPSGTNFTTSLTFVNPHLSSVSGAVAYFYDDSGAPLALDFGSGPVSTLSFTVPPQGSVKLRATSRSTVTVIGWAIVYSGLPLQGLVQYTLNAAGVPQQSISVQATAASRLFRSPATQTTGIAIANPSEGSISLGVSAIDGAGNTIGQSSLTVPPFGHRAFSLSQLFPGLPSNLQGSVVIRAGGSYFVALTISAEGAALSSYPPAGLNWPVSQSDVIWKVWSEVLNAANLVTPLNPPPKLVIDPSTGIINSFANPATNEVHIFLNLAELISDSESELAFVIGHELGHIIQAKLGLQIYPNNPEQDADMYGMLLTLVAGYDRYGAAGALAKLAMASGSAGLVDQNFDNLLAVAGLDLHGSFNNRMALVFTDMQSLCAVPQFQSFCSSYKSLVHPHLPPIAPLAARPSLHK